MSAVVFAFLVATASGRRVIQAADSDIVLDFSRHLSESAMMYGGYGYGGYYTPADAPELTEEPVEEPVATPPPVEVESITPPPEEVVMTPPPVDVEVAVPPPEELAATPPPPFADALINDSQEGLPFPPANPDGGPGQFSDIPGCQIDHVAEGSPGCELCQPGFFKLDSDKIANGDEICYPCDALENCSFCNDYFGCAQCDDGFKTDLDNIVVYNDGTEYFGVTFCV